MTDGRSRRDLLVGGVAVAAGLAVATAAGNANAQTGDAAILNGLLAAEYQAIKAYDAGAGILMHPPAGDVAAAAAPVALAIALHFQSQHRDHSVKLSALITSLNGTPVSEASVNFIPPMGFMGTVTNVIKLATNAEKGAAVAYMNALKNITSQTAANVVAAIGGGETQHFIVLFLVANGVVAPNMMTAMMASDIVLQSFVTTVGAGTTGLDSVPDFTFA